MTERKYSLLQKKCDFYGIAKELEVDPVLVRLMYNRGVAPDQMNAFLHPSLQDLHDPYLLPDVRKGAEILSEKISGGAPIRIIGDYDVDGVCSTFLLLQVLEELGADVDYRIPERQRHGYGLHEELIDLALADGRQVIVTCDNGISEAASIARAREYGMTVIVTDHHNVPARLPDADALIDPKITADDGTHSYPFTEICGAVVAMKFLQVLCEIRGMSRDLPLKYIEIAAMATVCDVMPLVDENRAIVKAGLDAVSTTKNPGLRALMDLNDIKTVRAWHFGFILGPCINAAGRLETAEKAMRLLRSGTEEEAKKNAMDLKELNEERKGLTQQGIDAARAIMSASDMAHDRVVVIHLPDCPDSIAGIVAGKVREQIYRPVFIITGTGEILKGSARSISGYSLFDEMTKVKDVFVKYGGHPLAAGFSLRSDRVGELRTRLNGICTLREEDLFERKKIDLDMPMSYVSLELLDQMQLLEPCGTGNASALFCLRKPAVLECAVRIGKNRNFLRITLRDEDGFAANAVYFGDADAFLSAYRANYSEAEEERLLCGFGRQKLKVIYVPKINEWRGERKVEFEIRDLIFTT